MANMKFDRGLEDLKFLTTRLAGLIDLGNRVQEAQVLLNRTEELKKMVDDTVAKLDDVKAKVTEEDTVLMGLKAKTEQAHKDWVAAEKKKEAEIKNLDQARVTSERDKKKLAEDIEKFRQDLLNQVATEADNKKVALAKEIVQEQEKLDALKAEIETLKSKF